MNYNRRNRRSLIISSRNLRRMKAEDGEHGGATPTPSADNTGGNTGGQSGDSTGADNTGQAPDYSQFWAEPSSDESSSAGSAGSAGNGTQGEGSPQNQQERPNPAATLGEDIGKIDFGANIMTQSAIEKLGNGDASEFHANLNNMGREAVTSAIRLMVPIMGQLRDQLRSEMTKTVDSTNTGRDDSAALLAAIPSSSDPKVKPIVESIFAQAKKITKGDRAAAISMTKDMLKLQMQTMSNDLGIPPAGSGNNSGLVTTETVDWLAELAGR